MRGLGGRAARALYVHRRAISDTTQEILSLEVVPLKGGQVSDDPALFDAGGSGRSVFILKPKRFEAGFEGSFELGHRFDHLRLNLRPLRLRAPVAAAFDNMFDATCRWCDTFPGKRTVERLFDFGFVSVKLIEEALFRWPRRIYVSSATPYSCTRLVEPEATDAGAAPSSCRFLA